MSQGGIGQGTREVQCIEIKCHESRTPVVVTNHGNLAPGSRYCRFGCSRSIMLTFGLSVPVTIQHAFYDEVDRCRFSRGDLTAALSPTAWLSVRPRLLATGGSTTARQPICAALMRSCSCYATAGSYARDYWPTPRPFPPPTGPVIAPQPVRYGRYTCAFQNPCCPEAN